MPNANRLVFVFQVFDEAAKLTFAALLGVNGEKFNLPVAVVPAQTVNASQGRELIESRSENLTDWIGCEAGKDFAHALPFNCAIAIFNPTNMPMA